MPPGHPTSPAHTQLAGWPWLAALRQDMTVYRAWRTSGHLAFAVRGSCVILATSRGDSGSCRADNRLNATPPGQHCPGPSLPPPSFRQGLLPLHFWGAPCLWGALSSPQLTPGHPGLHWPNPHVQPGRSPGKPDSPHAQETPPPAPPAQVVAPPCYSPGVTPGPLLSRRIHPLALARQPRPTRAGSSPAAPPRLRPPLLPSGLLSRSPNAAPTGRQRDPHSLAPLHSRPPALAP